MLRDLVLKCIKPLRKVHGKGPWKHHSYGYRVVLGPFDGKEAAELKTFKAVKITVKPSRIAAKRGRINS